MRFAGLFFLSLMISLFAASQPAISNFSPQQGPIGTTVTITGTGFSSAASSNIVYFGAVRAEVTSASPTQLVVTAPAGATNKPVSVTANNLTGFASKAFVITFPGGTDILQFPDQSQNAFDQQVQFMTGLHPYEVSVMDFDGDGKPDLATPNNFSITGEPASVSVLRNLSSGNSVTFAAKQDFETGVLTRSMATGDINGDGKPELVSGSIVDQSISVFRNTSTVGAISFAPKIDFVTGNSPVSIALADLDRDGRPDIIISNSSISSVNRLSIFRNTSSAGVISFAGRIDFDLPFILGPLVAADLDGDDLVDVSIVSEFSNSLFVLRNTSTSGSISFAASVEFATGFGPKAITAGDVDGDGRAELLAANTPSNNFSVLRNTSTAGAISFATHVDISCGANAYAIELGDINGDGKVDVIVPSINLGYCQNNSTPGSIQLAPMVYSFASPASNAVGIGDLTGDGKADLAVSHFSHESVGVFRNRINEPLVRQFTPETAASGATVTITGLNFGGTTGVLFGGVPSLGFMVVNTTTITAEVGPGISGAITVVSAYGQGSKDGFIFAGPPTISSFTPMGGPSGTIVTINGTNFTGATGVSFGGLPTTNYTVVSPTQITAEVQDAASGNVTITTPYGSASMDGFVVVPGITGFSPTSAATGQVVTISGTNLNIVNEVSFGGVPAASFTIINASTITAVVGNGQSGNVRVAKDTDSTFLTGFTYIPPPAIQSFIPTAAGQGTTVTITGTNFSNASEVRFGGIAAATFSVTNETTILAQVGPGSSGEITVVTPGGVSTLPGFTFIPAPSITGFNPVMTGAGGTVTITGTNLSGATSVSFGDVPAQSFTVVNAQEITAVVANGQSGQLKVITPGGVATAYGFSYTTLPVINSFFPASGAPGSSITIRGANFNAIAANNHVYFGPVKATVSAANANSLTVTVPFGATHDNITISTGQYSCESSIPFLVTFPGGGAFTQEMFAGRMDLVAGGETKGVICADFNNDGLPDIVAANSLSRTISIFRNQSSAGSLSFAPKVDFDATYSPYAFAVADLDADGRLDLICLNQTVGNYKGTVFRNTSVGSSISFGPRIDFESNFNPTNVVAADFTGDGKPDLAMSNTNTTMSGMTFITLVVNGSTPGNISFSNYYPVFVSGQVSDNERPVSIDKGDFNGDQRMDIVVGFANSFHRFVFTILRNDGGSFTKVDIPLQQNLQQNTRPLSVADFDNDGRPDIVGNGEYFRNTGNFTFEHLPADQMGLITDVGDLNGDGKVDYIRADAGGSTVTVFPNETTGTTIHLPQGFSYGTGNQPLGLHLTDLDADGKPEIITGNLLDGRVSILKNGLNAAGPLITSFSPTSGVAGTTVTITGTGFTGVTSVHFGGMPAASFVVNSSTSITAVTANGSSGNVEVETAAGNAVKAWFTFIPPPPTITAFTPTSAPYGATVTITGTNFEEVSSVRFGGIPAQSFNVVSPNTITAILDNGASGIVEVTTLGGIGSRAGFIFIPAPDISSFTPVSAGTGASVEITGTGFEGATMVSFGGMVATSFVVNSPTSITAIVSTGGSGPVRVTTPGGTAVKEGFVFIPPPFISNFFPASAAAGATVNIAGTNLTGATAVSFGGVAATSFTVVNDNNITAVVGNGASGEVMVTTSGGTATRAGFVFNFPTGINGPGNNDSPLLTLFPNPASGVITIHHPRKPRTCYLRILDIMGRAVRMKVISPNEQQSEMDLGGVAGGVYQLLWTDGTLILSRTFFVQ